MDTGARHGTISTDMLRILLGGAPLRKEQLAEILDLAGLDLAVLGSSQKRIPTEQLAIIWREMARGAGDPDLGLHLGQLPHGLPSGHPLFAAMLNSPTLGEALQRYCRYHDIMGDFVQPHLSAGADITTLTFTTLGQVKLQRQHVEFITSLIVSVVSHLSGAEFQGAVRFTHPAPADTSEHQRIFGASLHFAQRADELTFDNSYLALPITAADAELLGILEQYAERLVRRIRPEETWSGKVAEALSRILCDGKPRLPDVARRLALSDRSLQSKLKEEGTTYQAVLDSVRKQLATASLEADELSIAEVAFLLGFADQSAFSHAFRKWTGESPLRYRERSQQ